MVESEVMSLLMTRAVTRPEERGILSPLRALR